jgi:hypothetical protein
MAPAKALTVVLGDAAKIAGPLGTITQLTHDA